MKSLTCTTLSVLFENTISKGLNKLFNLLFYCLGVVILNISYQIYNLNYFFNANSERLSTFLSFNNDKSCIKNKVLKYNKLPSHLVIILGPEGPSYEDLVKIIVWCFFAGVKHISFYDHKNVLSPERLFDFVVLKGDCVANIKWGKSFNIVLKQKSGELIQGYNCTPSIHVNIYKCDDGFDQMIETVKSLHQNDEHNIKPFDLDTIFNETFGAPDPDLVIICGTALTPYGFPPWHLRITLFKCIPTHHNINISTFLTLFDHFNNSEQRYGK